MDLSNVTLANNIFRENTAQYGGVLYFSQVGSSNLRLINNTFEKNAAAKKYGEIFLNYVKQKSAFEIDSIEFLNNTFRDSWSYRSEAEAVD